MAHKHEVSDALEVRRPNHHRAAPDTHTKHPHPKVLGGSRGATHYEHGFNIAATKASAIGRGMSEHFLDWYTNDP
jgi:hypothetical protein